MELLIIGLLLWSGAHMVPVALPGMRESLVSKMGEMPFKGVFSLVVLGSVGLMVMGWRSIDEITVLYQLPTIASFIALLMLLAGFVLIAAANMKSNFKRTVRHPQLVGVTLWALAHLLVNGELRTTILFGAMASWSILTILLLNKRDGEFVPPKKELPHQGVIVFAVGSILFIAAALGHEYFTGISISAK